MFSSQRPGASGVYQKSADGTGEEQLLLKAALFAVPSSWSSDGRYLMYAYLGAGSNMDVGVIPMTDNPKPWAFLNSPFVEGGAEFSPDGRWVAYQSDEATRPEVYIRPFVAADAAGAMPAHSGKWQVSTAGGIHPKWSPDGKELFYLNPAGEMMAAPIAFSGSALTPGTSVKLFQTRIVDGGQNIGGPQYDVARDGRFLINTVLDSAAAEASPIILIQNWDPEPRK